MDHNRDKSDLSICGQDNLVLESLQFGHCKPRSGELAWAVLNISGLIHHRSYTWGSLVYVYEHEGSDVYDPLQTLVNRINVYKGV